MNDETPMPSDEMNAPVPLNNLSTHEEEPIKCPFCNKVTTSTIQKQHSAKTWGMCFFFFCLWTPKTCVPHKEAKYSDVEWFCEECRNKVAERRRDQPVQVFGPMIKA